MPIQNHQNLNARHHKSHQRPLISANGKAGGRDFYSVYFRFDIFAPSHLFSKRAINNDPD